MGPVPLVFSDPWAFGAVPDGVAEGGAGEGQRISGVPIPNIRATVSADRDCSGRDSDRRTGTPQREKDVRPIAAHFLIFHKGYGLPGYALCELGREELRPSEELSMGQFGDVSCKKCLRLKRLYTNILRHYSASDLVRAGR